MPDNIKSNTLVKLAQTRLAVNYVLRARAMQKQAWGDPFNDKYYNENGERNLIGLFSGVPSHKPVVTRINGNTPGTRNTLKVDIPGQPNKTMWFNRDSDENTNGIGPNSERAFMGTVAGGATLGGAALAPIMGPAGVFAGGVMGADAGAFAGGMGLLTKGILNRKYRDNMRDALKAHGYEPDMPPAKFHPLYNYQK